MKNFFRYLLNLITYKYVEESNIDARLIKLRKDEISYFNLSSNSIISFEYEGKLFYFRECPQRLSFQEYFKKAMEDFFFSIDKLNIHREHFRQEVPIRLDFSSSEIGLFRDYLREKQKDKMFWKRISQVDRISQKKKFSIWVHQDYDASFFCDFFMDDIPQQCYDIGVYFLWYMRGVCTTYKTLNIVHGKQYSYFSAMKSIASKIVAESMGLGHMITSAEFCKVEIEDEFTLYGVMSAAANGNRMLDLNIEPTGSLQKELLNLNILDLVCFQSDHGMNNYNIYEYDNQYLICAFDNDNPNTFLPIPTIRHNFLGCSSIVDKHGCFNRPYISGELIENLQKINIPSLRKNLKEYLNFLQIAALVFRIKKIQRIFGKLVNYNPQCVLENGQWNAQTVLCEMSGKYGETYLTNIVKGKTNTNVII